MNKKAISILRNDQDAEDTLQNALMKAWIHQYEILKESNYLAWINQIVYHECLDILQGGADTRESGALCFFARHDWRMHSQMFTGKGNPVNAPQIKVSFISPLL